MRLVGWAWVAVLTVACGPSRGVEPTVAAVDVPTAEAAEPESELAVPEELRPECSNGETRDCSCDDGSVGFERCTVEGEWARCECPTTAAIESFPQPATPMSCGSTRCQPVSFAPAGFHLAPCCFNAGRARCGVDVAMFGPMLGFSNTCLELDAPGSPDKSCSPLAVGSHVPFPGCRKQNGSCGVDVHFPGIVKLGCTEVPQALRSMVQGAGGPIPPQPIP